MKNNQRYLLFRTALLIILVFSFTGCNKNEVKVYTPIEYSGGDGYTTYTQQEGSVKFSFECAKELVNPDHGIIDLQLMLGTTIGNAKALQSPGSTTNNPTSIFIAYYDVNKDLPNVNDAVQKTISENKVIYKDYRLVGKNKVLVSGIVGIEIISSYTLLTMFTDMGAVPAIPALQNEKLIFLKHVDTIWVIGVLYDTTLGDQANAYFDHILQTFKILD